MKWNIVYLPEAREDLAALDGSQRKLVRKMIEKTSENPLPVNQGGYGKPLGNKNGIDLTGFLKIKLRRMGLRVIYKLLRTETQMLIVVIGLREENEAYKTASLRIMKYHSTEKDL